MWLPGFLLARTLVIPFALVASPKLGLRHVRLVKIVVPLDTFQQHLPDTFFQLEVGEMEIDKMLAWIKVQNLCIVGYTVIEKEQLTKINLGFEKNL